MNHSIHIFYVFACIVACTCVITLLYSEEFIPNGRILQRLRKFQPRDIAVSDPESFYKQLPYRYGRNDLGKLCELKGLKIGAELGVQVGNYARINLRHWTSCEKYILVDIWKHVPSHKHYHDESNKDDESQAKSLAEARVNLKEFSNITEFMVMSTVEAAKLIPDASLDYIYVDARHDYCGTMEDIVAWYPKIKSGGVMAGHDYLDGRTQKRISRGQDWTICANGTINEGAVKGAVDEYAAAHGIRVFTTSKAVDGNWLSWVYSPKP
mmetsp:Transcript_11123/g.11139  ORF Transcript_11123/g.11139 Transcript_11123/m.11139 type:complete len:267 (+) Transcript_11123:117-917(+)